MKRVQNIKSLEKISYELPVFFRYRILWHVFFWLAVYVTYVVSYGGYGAYGESNFQSEAVSNLLLFPSRMLFTYSMLYILLPRFLMQKKSRTFFALSAVHAVLLGFFIWMPLRWYHIHIEAICPYEFPLFHGPKILVNIISNYTIILIAAAYKLFKWWYVDQLYKIKIEKEKLESELKYLKAQIHPHFLFNTLNNLYALTLTNSEKASGVVLKLSNLLDYMLYHGNSPTVSLQKELNVLNDYIELERLRYGDRLNLNFEVQGDAFSLQVAPLVLMPFVENAFKHGASADRGCPHIRIVLGADAGWLSFSIENSMPEMPHGQPNTSKGIGLNNIQRQLELLYPQKHELSAKTEAGYFKVLLKLDCRK